MVEYSISIDGELRIVRRKNHESTGRANSYSYYFRLD